MQAKDRDWQTGKLIDVKNENVQRLVNGTSYSGELWNYTVDDGKYVWVMQRELHLRWDKPIFVTVNGPVKFAIDKHTAYLVDDDGKEHKLSLLSKSIKSTQ